MFSLLELQILRYHPRHQGTFTVELNNWGFKKPFMSFQCVLSLRATAIEVAKLLVKTI